MVVAVSTVALTFGLQAQSQAPSESGASTDSISQVYIRTTAINEGSVTLNVRIQGTPARFSAHLNGNDVSSRFSQMDCEGATCKTATLTPADGLLMEKDVLMVDAGRGLTGRLRFDAKPLPVAGSGSALPQARLMALNANATSKAQTAIVDFSSVLPPTISFTTLHPGGWPGGTGTWISVNGVNYPDVAPGGNCSGAVYLAVVLDRQTLAEKTSAPESSPMCLANAGALKAYLSTLTGNDLVIVGSNWEVGVDAGLDLSAIGGSAWGGSLGDGAYPAGIFAIGTPGAAQNSAYGAYFVSKTGYEGVNVFANGILQEDAYGNYNFQSSDVVEFAVSPNDTGTLTTQGLNGSAVSISVANPASGAIQQYVYTAPTGTNGYWLLLLSRSTLSTYPYGCTWGSRVGNTQYIPGCGKFYATGSSDSATSTAAYQSLASDLKGINSWQMAFLTTVGQAAYGGTGNSVWNVGGFNAATNYSNNKSNGFLEFSQALVGLGGTPNLTQSLLSPNSAYTFISSPGIGGPLNGNSVESTTVLASQGQTGFVHGIMERNLNGLYMPNQTNQEPVQLYAAKGGFSDPEFKLTEVALQQPVEWPSSSKTTLLSFSGCSTCGANTIDGQIAAYRYLSFVLMNIYIQGVQDSTPNLATSHLDDIHYFFTGSYNTAISYHNYDINNIIFPDPSIASGPYVYPCNTVTKVPDRNNNTTDQCTINSFDVDGQPLVFTSEDFFAVKQQLQSEILYLTNTLQFLVTGPNSMKSVIASSSSNVGLALTNAAANILGSSLQPVPPETVVTTSWQNIVSMIGGVSSLLSAVPGIGEIADVGVLATTGAKLFGGVATAIGGAASLTGAAGEITTSQTNSVLPSPYARFSNTVANMANGYLQNQLNSGFDVMADSITSDWGRLSILGPMSADPTNPVFFAPTYASESLAVNALTQAASRNFYIALLPAMGYNIDYYPSVEGWVTPPSSLSNIPDMGNYWTGGGFEHCSAMYLNPQENNDNTFNGLGTPAAYSFVYYPTVAGTPHPYSKNGAGTNPTATAVDMYVIGGKVSYPGTDHTAIGAVSADLASYLFTNSGLNLPIDEFVTQNGPMQQAWTNMSTNNRAGNSTGTNCPAQMYPTETVGVAVPTGTTTITTLSAPATSILGDDVSVRATVTAGSTPVATGSVYFTVDGAGTINANLNTQGVASATIPAAQLARGAHQIVALYSRVSPYETSQSAAVTLNVYTTAPDLNLSVSASSMSVGYGSNSSPVTLQLTSLSGLTGAVSLTCSGLPVGMGCNFNPAQVTLTANGQSSVSLVINGGSVSGSSLWVPGIGILLLPVSLICVGRIRKSARQVGGIFCLLLLSFIGISSLSGCSGGGSSSSNSFQETGTKTVLISASSGTISRTIPIQVSIK